MRELLAHDWPGNVRELENALTRGAIVARGPVVGREHLALGLSGGARRSTSPAAPGEEGDMTLDGAIERQIRRVLQNTGGNKTEAAGLLGISRSRLARQVERFGL